MRDSWRRSMRGDGESKAGLSFAQELVDVPGRSVCGLRSLSEEIIAALFGGREHVGELRRTSQVREYWTILQVGVGAVMPGN